MRGFGKNGYNVIRRDSYWFTFGWDKEGSEREYEGMVKVVSLVVYASV